MRKLIDFGRATPDLAPLGASALRAINLIPRTAGFGPLPALADVSNALEGTVLGAISARDTGNNVFVYAGTSSKLYEMTDNSFTDESIGGGYSTAADDVWEFAVTPTKVVATNFTDAVQSMDIGGGGSGAFANAIASVEQPKARHQGLVWQFLVLGNINSTADGLVPNRIHWSAIGPDITDFDPDAATQCDYEDLAEGGWVQKVVGGIEYGVIFQEQMIRRMQYRGDDIVFELFAADRVRGTPIPQSVYQYGRLIFFITEEGFAVFDGGQTTLLGDGQVDRSFWNQFDIANKERVSCTVDPVNKVVAWAFPGSGAPSGNPNKIFFCKYDERKWTEAEVDVDLLLQAQKQGFTLDGLDSLGTDIDDVSVFSESFDSDFYKGGLQQFSAFTSAHRLANFTGPKLKAHVITGDVTLDDSAHRTQVNGVRPLMNGGSARISIASRTRYSDGISFNTPVEMNIDGVCPQRAEGRYHRFCQSLSSSTSWSHVQGLEIDYAKLGIR